MSEDLVPTLRRAVQWVQSLLLSRRFWERLGVSGLVVLSVAGLGFLAAATSRAVCETKAREAIGKYLEPTKLQPNWASEASVREVPFPNELLESGVYTREARSIFRPHVAYRADSESPKLPNDRPPEAWGFVRSQVAFPFLVRAHYAWGYSYPRHHALSDSIVRWSRSGSYGEGVLTYVCAFGMVAPINNWQVGAMYD